MDCSMVVQKFPRVAPGISVAFLFGWLPPRTVEDDLFDGHEFVTMCGLRRSGGTTDIRPTHNT